MGSPFKRYIAGGSKETWGAFYDTNGMLCGSVTALAAGESSSLLRLNAVKKMSVATPERTRENQSGDDISQGFLTFDPIENTTTNIDMGVGDLDREAALQGTKVYDVGPFEIVGINPQIEDLPPMMLLNHSSAKKRVYGEQSQKGYEFIIMNYGEIAVKGESSRDERVLRDYTHTGTWERTTVWPWGKIMTLAAEGSLAMSGGRAIAVTPPHIDIFQGNGVLTTMTLSKKPLSDHTTTNIVVYQQDTSTRVSTLLVPTTAWTVVPSTGVVTFAVAPSATKRNYIVYLRAS